MSFENFVMYNAVVPSYDTDKDKKGTNEHEVIDADNPENKNQIIELINSLG